MVEFELNNQIVETGVVNWEELTVNATFNDEGVSAVVDINDAEFSGEEYKIIKSWVDNGLNGYQGIYEAMPIKIRLFNDTISYDAFEGYLNFKEKYVKEFDGKITTKINSNDDVLTLQEQLQSINYGLLYEQGFITDSDIIEQRFVVEKYQQQLEFALLSITAYLMAKEIIESIERISKRVTDLIKALTPNVGFPSVDTGDIISLALLTAIDITTTAFLLIEVIKLGRDLLDFIYSPVRKHKCLRFETLLRAAASKLGYGFETGITELNSWRYIPSAPDENIFGNLSNGIPTPADRGYQCDEMYQLVKQMFNAVITLEDNVIKVRSKNDSYWLKKSEYVLPDVLLEQEEFNTNEVVGNRFYKFETDVADKWTSVNYRGNSYSIFTTSKNLGTKNLINGFERLDYGVCLGTRKDGLNDLEKTLRSLLSVIDGIINTFGGNSNLAAKVENRVGMLKQSDRTHGTAKIIKTDSTGKLVDRDLMSAKYLYDNYQSYDSFVLNNFFGQKRIYEEIDIPFCLADFLKTVKNSYFTTSEGLEGKFTSLVWQFGKDKATASFWIREVHSKNLIEQYYEAD